MSRSEGIAVANSSRNPPVGPSADPRLNGIGRPRMTPAERAKIFMPFNPLKGFQEALREKEAEVEARAATQLERDPFA